MIIIRSILRFALLFSCALCSTASAGPDEREGIWSVTGAAEMVPGDVSFFAVVDGASALRSDLAGPTLDAIITLGSRGELEEEPIARRWLEFSRILGLGPDEAFDRLLGSHAILAIDEAGAWALISAVDSGASRQLAKSLRAAPRRAIKGRTVLEVESGSFLVTTERRKTRVGEEHLLLIGPRRKSDLFEKIAARLGKGFEHSLADEPAFANIRAMIPGVSGIVYRRDAEGGWSVTGFAHERRRVNATVIASSPGIRRGIDVPTWSRVAFDRLTDGALLAIAGWDPQEVLGAPLRWDFAHQFRFIPESVGPRHLIIVQPGLETPFALGAAFETDNVAQNARTTDTSLAALVARLDDDAERAPSELDYGGLIPTAIRDHRVPGLRGPGAERLVGEDPRIAWRHVRNASVLEAADAGWWVMGLNRPVVEEIASVLEEAPVRTPARDSQPWISLGWAAPSALTERLVEASPQFALMEEIRLLEGIRTLRWDFSLFRERRVLGHVEILLEDPALAR